MTSPRRMHASRIVPALLLGLATTVLIAWAAMFWPRGNGSGYYGPRAVRGLGLVRTADGAALWEVDEGRSATHRVVHFNKLQMSGMSFTIPEDDFLKRQFDIGALPAHLRPAAVDDLYMDANYREVGWPMPALTCSTHWVKQVSNADIIYEVKGGIQLPRDADFHPRALPQTPLWVGMAVDLTVWSGGWFVIIAGLAALRRWRRRRANCCIHCGYSRTGLAKGSRCPECGLGRLGVGQNHGTLRKPSAHRHAREGGHPVEASIAPSLDSRPPPARGQASRE